MPRPPYSQPFAIPGPPEPLASTRSGGGQAVGEASPCPRPASATDAGRQHRRGCCGSSTARLEARRPAWPARTRPGLRSAGSQSNVATPSASVRGSKEAGQGWHGRYLPFFWIVTAYISTPGTGRSAESTTRTRTLRRTRSARAGPSRGGRETDGRHLRPVILEVVEADARLDRRRSSVSPRPGRGARRSPRRRSAPRRPGKPVEDEDRRIRDRQPRGRRRRVTVTSRAGRSTTRAGCRGAAGSARRLKRHIPCLRTAVGRREERCSRGLGPSVGRSNVPSAAVVTVWREGPQRPRPARRRPAGPARPPRCP